MPPPKTAKRFEIYAPIFPRRTDRLHAMVINCGHELVTTTAYNWDGLKRGAKELVIWQHTLSGMGKLRFGSVEYPVPPGRAMLLIVPENHCYFLPKDSPEWEFLFVSLNGSEMVRLAAELRRRKGVLLDFAADSPTVKAAWAMLRFFRENREIGRYETSAAAYRFMMTMLAEQDRDDDTGPSRYLRPVHEYCLAHLGEPISVGELAAVAGCSRSHFSRAFRQAQGVSPHEFVNGLKMRLAMRLLQTTAATVKEIAAQCGFDDTSYFCRVFRRVHRLTPGEFRSGAALPPERDSAI